MRSSGENLAVDSAYSVVARPPTGAGGSKSFAGSHGRSPASTAASSTSPFVPPASAAGPAFRTGSSPVQAPTKPATTATDVESERTKEREVEGGDRSWLDLVLRLRVTDDRRQQLHARAVHLRRLGPSGSAGGRREIDRVERGLRPLESERDGRAGSAVSAEPRRPSASAVAALARERRRDTARSGDPPLPPK